MHDEQVTVPSVPVVHDLISDGTAVLADPSAGALLDKFLAVLSPEVFDAAGVETRGVGRGRRRGRGRHGGIKIPHS